MSVIGAQRRARSAPRAYSGKVLSALLLGTSLGGEPGGSHQSSVPFSPASQLIREEQTVVVDGFAEVWRLEWKAPPKPVCGLDSPRMNLTCPCQGFAFGEGGQLDLVRMLNNTELDRLALTPLFKNRDQAVVQRWAVQDHDIEESETDGFAARVRARPVVTIMHFADYDHNGNATEFYLQTETGPCGKLSGVVVGVSRKNLRLHAFTTALHPEKPLILHNQEWEALLGATGPVQVLHWGCGDHASERETDIELSVKDEGIQAVSRVFDCTWGGKRGPLLREDNL